MIQFGDARLPTSFWNKVEVEPYGCWLWTAALRTGYGRFRLHQKDYMAHRFAFSILVKQVLVELDCDHLCRVRRCVNPAHIEIVTRRENLRRGVGVVTMANALKTHCDNGHEFTSANTKIRITGWRTCRECLRVQNRRVRRRVVEQNRLKRLEAQSC